MNVHVHIYMYVHVHKKSVIEAVNKLINCQTGCQTCDYNDNL